MSCFLLLTGASDPPETPSLPTPAPNANDYLTAEEQSGETPIDLTDKLFSILTLGTTRAVKLLSPRLAALFGVLLLSSMLHALGELHEAGGLSALCDFAVLLSVSGVVYSILGSLFAMAKEALTGLTTYMTALLPVTTAVLISGGNPTTAATSAGAFSLFLTCAELLSSGVLFPLLQTSFTLCFAGAMPGAVDLSPLSSLVRNTFSVLLAFLYTTLGFLIGAQSVLSASKDGFLYRTIRFASGVFIPVVGGLLGDAARTVASGIGVIRSTVGTVGLVVTLALLLPPLITVLAHRFLFSLSAALAKMLGCSREASLLSDLGSVLGLLSGVLIGSAAVAVLYLACFIRVGG